jgi:hypothetical protein
MAGVATEGARSAAEFAGAAGWFRHEDSGGEAGVALAEALAVFVALEPEVDHLLGGADALHVEDGFGAGGGHAAVVDELVEVAGGGQGVSVVRVGLWSWGGIEEGNLVVAPAASLRPAAEWCACGAVYLWPDRSRVLLGLVGVGSGCGLGGLRSHVSEARRGFTLRGQFEMWPTPRVWAIALNCHEPMPKNLKSKSFALILKCRKGSNMFSTTDRTA